MVKDPYAVDVLQRELNKLNSKLIGVVAKCESNPASELIELMEQARIKISQFPDITDPKLMKWLTEAAKKEKRLKKEMDPIANKKNWDNRFKIETQRGDISNAIFKLSL